MVLIQEETIRLSHSLEEKEGMEVYAEDIPLERNINKSHGVFTMCYFLQMEFRLWISKFNSVLGRHKYHGRK
jgi:hypothetical protein